MLDVLVVVLQAFSIFFVCVTITSDVACYLLIPVQWLFFTASTYVWVQYIWQTGMRDCEHLRLGPVYMADRYI